MKASAGPGAGASVVLAARRQVLLDETAQMVRELGGAALVHVVDLTSEEGCAGLVTAALDRFGRVDILLNNAAVPGRDEPISAMSLENWNTTIATNIFSSATALRRLVGPKEVAELSVWLASDASSAMTGQNINATAEGEKR